MAKTTRELAQIAQTLSAAELRVSTLRGQLDRMLFDLHGDGCSIVELARTANVSRETVYKAIARYRSRAADPPG
jgi:Mor family transcriptional regulator